MPNWRESEEVRETLTNEQIVLDLKKEATSKMLISLSISPIMLLLGFIAVMLIVTAVNRPENDGIGFVIAAILPLCVALLAMFSTTVGIVKAVGLLRAVNGKHFTVTTEELQKKEEGKRSPLRFYYYVFSVLSNPFTPDRYFFHSGTYEVPVEEAHFRHSKRSAMNESTLFRRSKSGDPFLVVSLNGKKPIGIYPTDMFDYRDSSPT